METALDVLSRAATMVQDSANEARITKELPSAKWRRERRLRTGEYQTATLSSAAPLATVPTHSNMAAATATMTMDCSAVATARTSPNTAVSSQQHISRMMVTRPQTDTSNPVGATLSLPPLTNSLCLNPAHVATVAASTSAALSSQMDSPIDMSVSSALKKQRSSPPPPYREPLPGSSYATLARPSVITQAPPKRNFSDSIMFLNRENSCEKDSDVVCDSLMIDEHFRRSLGPDYATLFNKKSPTTTPTPAASTLNCSAAASPFQTTSHITPTSTPPMTIFTRTPEIELTNTSSSPKLPIYQAHQMSPSQNSLAPMNLQKQSSVVNVLLTAANAQRTAISPTPMALLPTGHMQRQTHYQKATESPSEAQALAIMASTSNMYHKSSKTNGKTPHKYHLHHSPQAAQHVTPPPAHVHSNCNSSPSPTPLDSPSSVISSSAAVSPGLIVATSSSTSVKNSTNAPTSTVTMPAILRIKTEPGLVAASSANTPPASPTSSSNSSTYVASSNVLVDDHFVKSLGGDTWKKLQENKELRK